jgi:hypothetical protein
LECITEAPIAAAGISIRYTIVYADDVAGVADTTLASNKAPLGSQGECNGCCQEDTNESGFVHGEYYGCTQDSMDEKVHREIKDNCQKSSVMEDPRPSILFNKGAQS